MKLLSQPVRSRGTQFAVRKPKPKWSTRTKILLASVTVCLLVLISGGVYWALHTPILAVTRIETGSYRFTSPVTLDTVLGDFLGRNLLSLRNGEVADSLASLAWVRDLRVQRRIPGTLAIDFREWRPLAILAQKDLPSGAQGREWALGENGQILEFYPGMDVPALPTLLGCHVLCLPPDSHCQAAQFADQTEESELLELFHAIAAVGLEAVTAVDFIVVHPSGYAIVLEGSQGRLQVGREDFQPRLERYLAAKPHLEPGLVVDLRFADRVTVHRLSD